MAKIPCDFVERNGYCECARGGCGRRVALKYETCGQHNAMCRVQTLYLGDMLGALASAIGIHKTDGCGCDERRRKLNDLDRKVRSLFR